MIVEMCDDIFTSINCSYVCEGQSKGIVPELRLLGFFIPSDDFRSVENAAYDPSFCDEVSEKGY